MTLQILVLQTQFSLSRYLANWKKKKTNLVMLRSSSRCPSASSSKMVPDMTLTFEKVTERLRTIFSAVSQIPAMNCEMHIFSISGGKSIKEDVQSTLTSVKSMKLRCNVWQQKWIHHWLIVDIKSIKVCVGCHVTAIITGRDIIGAMRSLHIR